MFKKGLFLVFAVALAASAFQFKAVSSPNATRMLRAQIVVPDNSTGNAVRQVGEGSTFFDYDRFRVSVQPKRSGHVYLFSRNRRGDVQLLYPLRDDGDGFVARNQRVDLPGDGWLRFDEMAGQEELILIESVQPLAEIEQWNEDGDAADPEVLDRYEHYPTRNMLVQHMFLEHENR